MRSFLCVIFSQVSDLIGKIQKAYVETLEELSWMDSPSKEKAREKVQYIAEQRVTSVLRKYRCISSG